MKVSSYFNRYVEWTQCLFNFFEVVLMKVNIIKLLSESKNTENESQFFFWRNIVNFLRILFIIHYHLVVYIETQTVCLFDFNHFIYKKFSYVRSQINNRNGCFAYSKKYSFLGIPEIHILCRCLGFLVLIVVVPRQAFLYVDFFGSIELS